mmetsp:Transcript_15361/g.48294  ORF Transcript_15361/g.48294 Transcript_15361/m.48294 type:complete len:348 (-) Transcript_15361:303-1346(-)
MSPQPAAPCGDVKENFVDIISKQVQFMGVSHTAADPCCFLHVVPSTGIPTHCISHAEVVGPCDQVIAMPADSEVESVLAALVDTETGAAQCSDLTSVATDTSHTPALEVQGRAHSDGEASACHKDPLDDETDDATTSMGRGQSPGELAPVADVVTPLSYREWLEAHRWRRHLDPAVPSCQVRAPRRRSARPRLPGVPPLRAPTLQSGDDDRELDPSFADAVRLRRMAFHRTGIMAAGFALVLGVPFVLSNSPRWVLLPVDRRPGPREGLPPVVHQPAEAHGPVGQQLLRGREGPAKHHALPRTNVSRRRYGTQCGDLGAHPAVQRPRPRWGRALVPQGVQLRRAISA